VSISYSQVVQSPRLVVVLYYKLHPWEQHLTISKKLRRTCH